MAVSVEPVAPSGQWVVDFADHQCVASRTFGDSKNPLMLVLKPSPTSDVVQLILIKKGGPAYAVQEDALLTLGRSGPVKVKQLRYAIKDKGFLLINLAAEQAAALSGADTLIWAGDGPDKSFSTGPIKQLMQTLATCRADLQEYWNISPAKRDSLKSTARPRKPLVRYFNDSDYPRQAIINDEGGLTSIALLVDEKGSIRDCMIDGTSNIATLDAMTCIVLRERAKFDPAIDKEGKAARSHYMQKVRWVMPR